MGTQIGMFKSETLPPGLHVAPNARAALIANGWTEPSRAPEMTEAECSVEP